MTSLEDDGRKDVVDVVDEELFLLTKDFARAEVDEVAENQLRVGAGTHLPSTGGENLMLLSQHGSFQARQGKHGDAGGGLRPEEKFQQHLQDLRVWLVGEDGLKCRDVGVQDIPGLRLSPTTLFTVG